MSDCQALSVLLSVFQEKPGKNHQNGLWVWFIDQRMNPPSGEAARIGPALKEARLARNMSQRDLATLAGVSHGYISLVEKEHIRRPSEHKLSLLLDALGFETVESVLQAYPLPSNPEPTAVERSYIDNNVSGRLAELRPREAALLPIYRWGAGGDPRDDEHSPNPDRYEYSPLGRETLIGPRGFGVAVRGESMADRNLHDGDVAWINPDRPYHHGALVLVGDGDGLAIVAYDSDVSRAVIGPVVWITRGFPPA